MKKKGYLQELQIKAQNLECENNQLRQQVQYLTTKVEQLTAENIELKQQLQRTTQQQQQRIQPPSSAATDISVSIIGLSSSSSPPLEAQERISKSSPFSFFESLTSFERPQLTSTSSTLIVTDVDEPFKAKTYFLIFLFFFAFCFFGRWGLQHDAPFSNKPLFPLSGSYEERQHLGRTLQESPGLKESAFLQTDQSYSLVDSKRLTHNTAHDHVAAPTTMSAVFHDEMHTTPNQLSHVLVGNPSEVCSPHNSTISSS